MSIVDRREREKAQRRNTIIDAAEKLFFSKGIGSTTIDEIAEYVELSKATIYLYFKSKEELYCAIIKRAMDIAKKMMKEASTVEGNGLVRLYSVGMTFYEFYKQYPNYFEALFHRESNNALLNKENYMVDDLIKEGEEMFDIAVNVIKDGIEDGSIRPDVDPYKTGLSLDGIFSGLIRVVSLEEDHLMKYHKVSSEELIAYSFEMIGHALENKNSCQDSSSHCGQPVPMKRKTPDGRKHGKKKENNR
jgi:TetR/AcrR family transcriptional regulator